MDVFQVFEIVQMVPNRTKYHNYRWSNDRSTPSIIFFLFFRKLQMFQVAFFKFCLAVWHFLIFYCFEIKMKRLKSFQGYFLALKIKQ